VRKLRELLYAVEMERTLGKPRILRLYLDNAPWVRACAGPRPLPSTTSACERTN
jgi:membrane peptidoglycan carboxypeptidase